MDLLDATLTRVVATDPYKSIEEILTAVEHHAAAVASGFFVEREDDELAVAALRGVDQNGLDRVRAAWAQERERLRDGRPVSEERWCVWPVAAGKRQALIYLETDEPVQIAAVRQAVMGLEPLLRAALAATAIRSSSTEAAAIEWQFETSPARIIEKRRFAALLTRHEWNLSRVARELGVTRVTIYARMKKLGIERIKVPKSRPHIL